MTPWGRLRSRWLDWRYAFAPGGVRGRIEFFQAERFRRACQQRGEPPLLYVSWTMPVSERVRGLVEELQRAGAPTQHRDWEAEFPGYAWIRRRVNECDALVVSISRESYAATYQLQEVWYAAHPRDRRARRQPKPLFYFDDDAPPLQGIWESLTQRRSPTPIMLPADPAEAASLVRQQLIYAPERMAGETPDA